MASTTLIDLGPISQRLGLPAAAVEATVRLLDEGNTVPFITRYRRDQTGGLDEVAIRLVAESVGRARQLAARKQTILRTIQGQGRLTPELETRIAAAESPKQLEDLYLPFKPRKLSLAEIARQRKLEPLAREIVAADPVAADLDARAADFVDADAQVTSVADVLLGVGHIIAEDFSERADLRQRLRGFLQEQGRLTSQRVETAGKPLSKEEKHYRDFFEYSEHVQRVPPHRVLAINRGERAKLLKVRIEGPAEEMQAAAEELLITPGHPHGVFLGGCVRDALARLVLPSLERELRREMTDYCEAHAVEVFARNLRNLLLQSPVTGRRVLAIDPGFKSGCKAVAIDEFGTPLEHAVLHIVGKAEKRAAAAAKIVEMVTTHSCSVIAVGNGTAGREVETLVAELVTGELQALDVGYCVVNEAGASVYSTSRYAREELAAYEAAARGAISIGRRLQDPLSELVKIEPANIGVGLYQHDVKARHLHASLDAVVESCVNYVGVDVNTASPALLRYVSGLNQATARNVHEWRAKNGPFASRKQLLEVPGFGEAAFVQAVGFLKITGGVEPLDSTWIHPESYEVAAKVLERLGGSREDLAQRQSAGAVADRAAAVDLDGLARELGVGRLLLADIVEQLSRPGRDPREDLPKPFFKKGVLKLEDLAPGMELMGSVLNVVDFGAFVDIGMHDSGLVHISQLSNRYVRDPHELLSVGQVVSVWVLAIDKARRRVSLTMIPPGPPRRPPADAAGGEAGRRPREGRPPRPQGERPARPPAAEGQRPPPSRGSAEGRRDAGPPPPRDRRGGGGDGRGRGRPQRAAQAPRVYVANAPRKPAAPLSKAMRDGKEPLRTFGDLKQFFTSRQGDDDEPEVAEQAGVEREPPGDTSAAERTGGPVDARAGGKPPAGEAVAGAEPSEGESGASSPAAGEDGPES
jgi:uncharacterized protein